ncbi:hypothetical protein GXP70_08200 [Paenibacillus lycopersici]|uniref:Uncharacterized protein n=1 Tax=Paenibacillus lycopersici TaxID=2704462 RepID=A0A6C0G4S6_9BACL|nr:hypothetical protein [Paenibacillus lycopersici]QHT59935.1 hypothetical protein GXP70_08200 [Paenibacillus lycopersici]
MVNKQQFYCVCCGEMLNLQEAEKLFLTGFYRIEYPLGCCTACMRTPSAPHPFQNVNRPERNKRAAFDEYGRDDAEEPMFAFI